jgi:hypothetical protein
VLPVCAGGRGLSAACPYRLAGRSRSSAPAGARLKAESCRPECGRCAATSAARDATPHALRHSFRPTILAGARSETIQELLGHASLSRPNVIPTVDVTRLAEVHRAAHPVPASDPSGIDASGWRLPRGGSHKSTEDCMKSIILAAAAATCHPFRGRLLPPREDRPKDVQTSSRRPSGRHDEVELAISRPKGQTRRCRSSERISREHKTQSSTLRILQEARGDGAGALVAAGQAGRGESRD